MTANHFAALLDGVPRYRHEHLGVMVQTKTDIGVWFFVDQVLAALAAAVPADLAEAGKVLEEPQPRTLVIHHKTPCKCETFTGSAADCRTGIVRCHQCGEQIDRIEIVPNPDFDPTPLPDPKNVIRALLARIAAQEAQIKELEKDREAGAKDYCALMERYDGLHNALAAMTKERDELRASIAWVDEVYPERIEAGGAGIQITWEEFNAMQAAIGVTVDKRIGGPEGKAVHNQRLRSALATERAKTAKLVEAAKALQADMLERARIGTDTIHGEEYRIVNAGRTAWADFCTAITEAQQWP